MINLPYKPGDTAYFDFAGREVRGRVEEDRGSIGISGRRLYVVSIDIGLGLRSQGELPADQLRKRPRASGATVRAVNRK